LQTAFQQQLAQHTAENAALLQAWEEEDRLRQRGASSDPWCPGLSACQAPEQSTDQNGLIKVPTRGSCSPKASAKVRAELMIMINMSKADMPNIIRTSLIFPLKNGCEVSAINMVLTTNRAAVKTDVLKIRKRIKPVDPNMVLLAALLHKYC